MVGHVVAEGVHFGDGLVEDIAFGEQVAQSRLVLEDVIIDQILPRFHQEQGT